MKVLASVPTTAPGRELCGKRSQTACGTCFTRPAGKDGVLVALCTITPFAAILCVVSRTHSGTEEAVKPSIRQEPL